MRFLLYDAIEEIEKGKYIKGYKTFSLSDESLRGHFGETAWVPGVLFIESMAQLLGWLVIFSHDFSISAVMTLVENVKIPSRLRPGFRAEIQGEILSTSERDSLGCCRMYVDGEMIASVERIIYVHSRRADSGQLMNLFRYYGGMVDRA